MSWKNFRELLPLAMFLILVIGMALLNIFVAVVKLLAYMRVAHPN